MSLPPPSALGNDAENKALAFLQDRGLKLLARNWKTRFGEIDLVMAEGGIVVFVEVRKRSRQDFGGARQSVGWQKRRRLIATARAYLAQRRESRPCRFDCVFIEGREEKISWVRNAFDETSYGCAT